LSEVSYQTFLADAGLAGSAPFVALPPDALATRRKDASRRLDVRISKRQAKWLDHVENVTGAGIDADAVVRVLIDLGRELDIDWAMTAGAPALRAAVRDAVRVRQATSRR
jgi:hypothetical protein